MNKRTIRKLVRKEMKQKEYPNAALSEKSLKEVWGNEPEGLWESYLKNSKKE